MTKSNSKYNATCEWFDENGKSVSLEVVRVENGRICLSNGHWSPSNGTESYHDEWLAGKFSFQKTYKIYMDNGERYAKKISGFIG